MLGTLSVVTAGLTSLLVPVIADRRLRTVERDPRRATTDDVEAVVRAHGVPESKVWAVCDRLASADLDPALVWAWTMAFDGNELADLCASCLSDGEVLTHLQERTAYENATGRVALTA